jgi:chorismate mutase / prephenate dehydratase
MTKKKSAGRGGDTSNAAHLQAQLERFDLELVQLLNQRAEVSQDLLRGAQHEEVAPPPDPGFWEASLQRVVASNRGPLDDEAVRAIFRELLSGIGRLRCQVRVCYLGPELSYSHLAAVERFGTSAELVPVVTISSVFDALNRGQADYGLVPLENSTDGRVADTMDMFARMPVHICGEVQLRIHHQLLGKCRRLDVREVCSKPQALSQCRTWLARHLPEARTVEVASTAAAACLAAEKPGVAAIASRQAGTHYGLDLIAENIEDNRHNVTRFAVIGDHLPQRTGDDKTSLMFELPHRPGALADAMSIFKRNRLNLTWIESFPMPEAPNEYLFFVEFQGHPDELRAKRALSALKKKTVRVAVLGTYPAARPMH